MNDMKELERLKQQVAALESELSETQSKLARETQRREDVGSENAGLLDRMGHLLSLLPAGVILLNGRGVVSEANPAAEALLGLPLKGESWVNIIQRSFAPRGDDGHEVSLRDGRRVSLQTRAMDLEPGQLILLTDQTETRLLQGRLAHYQRLSEMGRMVASLAHQIRTPLSAALLYIDHLNRPDLAVAQRQKFAGKIKSRLVNLEQQVRDMLIFARGEMRLDDTVSSAALMEALEDQLDLPLVNYDADCECINHVPDLLIHCNQEALLGVCMNLVENALQASGQGCELQISVSQQADMLRLDIIDHGPGMDSETVKQALQPFFTTKSHGTGLGLAVAQVVAHAHHGRFEICSELGVGTTATLWLPCQSDSSRTSAKAE
ncbi:ATP-binding protein [Neptuniibacter sp. CAU 1671]|uniref:sensor histidine kinase n=1 Tax=Neptuniibacter sp. CAU 1671 TaxID=3032593 RepID=UPI0023DBDCAD|nr:ATP-binding protein [Neptuniibacter sp. CAU 1671]MDF2181339.1 ATP-binding protein [Neptuniibacter sp. CAU 1671]